MQVSKTGVKTQGKNQKGEKKHGGGGNEEDGSETMHSVIRPLIFTEIMK